MNAGPLDPAWFSDVGILIGGLGLMGVICALIEGPPMTSRPWWELMTAACATVMGLVMVLMAVTP